MKQHFTKLDLIRFLYKETSAAETVAVQEELSKNPLLEEEYIELFDSYRQLPKAKFSPQPSALHNILRYSEQTALNPTL